jgi:hypothetical protein
MYEKATINTQAFSQFSDKLKKFLSSELSPEVFINFLRYHMNFKKCFQYRHFTHGHNHYIGLETIFEYEHSTKYSFSGSNREALINEIEEEEFSHHELDNRMIIQDIEAYLEKNKHEGLAAIRNFFIEHAKATKCNNEENINQLFNDLTHFLTVVPQLPSNDKQFVQEKIIPIHVNQSREEIIHAATMAHIHDFIMAYLQNIDKLA